jgi:L-iditol 2-dehydrogenase
MAELPEPEPGPGEVVLSVDAATTCATDAKILSSGSHPALPALPSPFGHEAAGTVLAVGAGVDTVRVGDRVAPANSAPCGRCSACLADRESLCADLAYLWGAYAERLRVPARIVERNLVAIPDRLPAYRASLAEPLACAVRAARRLGNVAGARLTILGGGTQGAFLTTLLSRGGARVTVFDPNEERRARARAFGASEAHPVARSATGALAERHGSRADVVVEAVGDPRAWEAAVDLVRPGGTVLFYGGCAPGTAVSLPTGRLHYEELTLIGSYHHDPAAFREAVELLAEQPVSFDALLGAPVALEEVPAALRERGPKRPVVTTPAGA